MFTGNVYCIILQSHLKVAARWITILDYYTGLLYWITILDYYTGLLYWIMQVLYGISSLKKIQNCGAHWVCGSRFVHIPTNGLNSLKNVVESCPGHCYLPNENT